MSPADVAAYAALELPPGADWPAVRRSWRRLMKRHHPDSGAATVFDARRVREANAAYTHLRARVSVVDGTVSRSRHVAGSRAAVWDALWDARSWPSWVPGLRVVEPANGGGDRRIALGGRWAGHQVRAVVVLMTVLPRCRLSGRVLDFRVDGVPVRIAPPRVWARVDEAPGGGAVVELGVSLPDGSELPPVIAAALDAALVELAEAV
jgi:Polyketide cyclase / dehydrase and lipid transport